MKALAQSKILSPEQTEWNKNLYLLYFRQRANVQNLQRTTQSKHEEYHQIVKGLMK